MAKNDQIFLIVLIFSKTGKFSYFCILHRAFKIAYIRCHTSYASSHLSSYISDFLTQNASVISLGFECKNLGPFQNLETEWDMIPGFNFTIRK